MLRETTSRFTSYLFAVLLVGGCAGNPDDPLEPMYTSDSTHDDASAAADLGSARQALQGGLNQDGDPAPLGLVRLFGQRPEGFRAFCSGVAVTPTHIVTAKHCVRASGLAANQVLVTLGNASAWGSSTAFHAKRDYAVLTLASSLSPPLASSFWRPVAAIDPQGGVGLAVACAGRGAVKTDGTPDFNAPITGDFFTILQRDTTPNTTGFWIRTGAFGSHSGPGDSGGPCFLLSDGVTTENAVLIGVIATSGGAPDWWTFVQTFTHGA